MCTSTAFLESDSGRETLMEELASIDVDGDCVQLRSLFGETRELQARISEIDFENGDVILVAVNPA